MRRREFITLLGGAAAWPLAARAQQPAMPVIGFLNPAPRAGYDHILLPFHQGLNEIGFVEGKNVAVQYRWANGQYARLPELAAELVHRQVDVIAATSDTSAQAAQKATTTIPIVFGIAQDPVQLGLVASLNRPGGNATGVSRLNVELTAKRLELLHEAVPTATTIGLLVNSTSASSVSVTNQVNAAVRALGLRIEVLNASTLEEMESAFTKFVQLRCGAVTIGSNSFFNSHGQTLGSLSVRHRIPAIYQEREFVAGGGLISYGASLANTFHLVGNYVGRILKGDRPADLPVQQSTKIDLLINLKTAKTLGLTVPPTLLALADEVIE